MLGPCIDLLQKNDIINISDNVQIISKCDNKISFLILVNEGLTTISFTSKEWPISVHLVPTYLKSIEK